MKSSHTKKVPVKNLRLIPSLGTFDLGRSGLSDSLVEKLEGELEVFAASMRYGLLSAAVAVGLEVFSELLQTNVTEIAGEKGKHDPRAKAKS